MAENWKQEGPLGLDGDEWAVSADTQDHYAVVTISDVATAIILPRDAQQLRDFARALERAADALEGKE